MAFWAPERGNGDSKLGLVGTMAEAVSAVATAPSAVKPLSPWALREVRAAKASPSLGWDFWPAAEVGTDACSKQQRHTKSYERIWRKQCVITVAYDAESATQGLRQIIRHKTMHTSIGDRQINAFPSSE